MFNPILYFQYSLSTLNDGLVAYYNFNGSTNESTGKSPNGVSANTTYVSGMSGQCVSFANISARVDIIDSDNFSFTTGNGNDVPFSISMWVYFTAFTTAAGDYGNWLINKRNTTAGGDEWQIILYKDNFYFTKFDRVSNTINQKIRTSGNPFSLNTWYHITCTDDGSKTALGMKIYINGTLISTSDDSIGVYTGIPNGTAITRLGLNAWDLGSGSALRHQGYIDEVGVWKNRCLSPNDVKQLYNSGSGKFYPF